MKPELGETAKDARARGVAVPDHVPDTARFGTKLGLYERVGPPAWMWFSMKPYETSRAELEKILAPLSLDEMVQRAGLDPDFVFGRKVFSDAKEEAALRSTPAGDPGVSVSDDEQGGSRA